MPRHHSPQIAAAATLLAQLLPGMTPDYLAHLLHQGATGGKVGESATAPGQLLTVKAAAARLGMGQRTIWRWQKLGVIPSVRMGRRVRFRETDIAKIARTGLGPHPGAPPARDFSLVRQVVPRQPVPPPNSPSADDTGF